MKAKVVNVATCTLQSSYLNFALKVDDYILSNGKPKLVGEAYFIHSISILNCIILSSLASCNRLIAPSLPKNRSLERNMRGSLSCRM